MATSATAAMTVFVRDDGEGGAACSISCALPKAADAGLLN